MHALAQKVLQAHTDTEITGTGQVVRCPVSLTLANDITGPFAVQAFRAMGAKRVFDRDKVALVMDHFTPQVEGYRTDDIMEAGKTPTGARQMGDLASARIAGT